MDEFLQSLPWWGPAVFYGTFVGLTVPLLYLLTGQGFGISTSLQQIGSICSPGSQLSYFRDFDRRKGIWVLIFAVGVAVGGFVATRYLSSEPLEFLPEFYQSVGGAVRLFLGGILIGFGARYAGGCTSGHSITGIANLNWPSLVATIFFFVGGLGVTWGLGSLIF